MRLRLARNGLGAADAAALAEGLAHNPVLEGVVDRRSYGLAEFHT